MKELEELSFIGHQSKALLNQFLSEKDTTITDAIKRHGFNPGNFDYLRDNFAFISPDGDPYEHLYFHHGQPDEIRIISIEKHPLPEITYDGSKTVYRISAKTY